VRCRGTLPYAILSTTGAVVLSLRKRYTTSRVRRERTGDMHAGEATTVLLFQKLLQVLQPKLLLNRLNQVLDRLVTARQELCRLHLGAEFFRLPG
jgi:hypothetical protein